MRRDEGSGTVLAVGLVALIAGACLLVGALAIALLDRERVAAAADSAALAGADVASGLAIGRAPCDRAATVATADGAMLAACEQRGAIVRVRAVLPAGPITASASAVAGPAATG